jgi:hypothetical protein
MHIAADLGAPIACDMSTAPDTPRERVAEYRQLFERSLLRRERSDDAVVFVFRAESATRVAELARREAECCPFLEHRVMPLGDQVIWTIADPARREAASVILDGVYTLPSLPR